jgi:hypothetical protein
MTKQLLAAAAVLALLAPVAVQAQELPSYAQSQAGAGGGDQQVRGRIADFDGGYNLEVRDANGYVDSVRLHDGTIINPVGVTLAPGMVVSILGYNAGTYFAANEVDTPYTMDEGVPYFEGEPWTYYGPAIGLGFFFGYWGWWHPSYVGYLYHPGIYHGGFYHGGFYHGGNYHGGYPGAGYYHGFAYNRGAGFTHAGYAPRFGGAYSGHFSGGTSYGRSSFAGQSSFAGRSSGAARSSFAGGHAGGGGHR